MGQFALKWLFVSWVLEITIFAARAQQFPETISFEKEKIRIEIRGDECRIIGDYYFKNNSSQLIQSLIYYPIAKRKNLPFPHYFQVTELTGKENIRFHVTSDGIRFSVVIPGFSMRTYRVEYHQKTPAKELEYILTTTALWGKPLRSADFEISLPKKFVLDSLSLPFQVKKEVKNKAIYFIHREKFLPQKNLIIQWRQYDEKDIH